MYLFLKTKNGLNLKFLLPVAYLIMSDILHFPNVLSAFLPLDTLGGKMKQTQALKPHLRLDLCPSTS